MSETDFDLREHILELIVSHIGDEDVELFIEDFYEWFHTQNDDDKSVSSIDTEADLSKSVCEIYTMDDVVVDEDGFWSLKEK